MTDKTVGRVPITPDLIENKLQEADAIEANVAIEALIMIAQTRSIERAVSALSLDAMAFEGSNGRDNPDAVLR